MCPRIPGTGESYIVVADEDRTIANFVIETLEAAGHSVFWAYDGVSATQLALGLKSCDLVISNSRVGGRAGRGPDHRPAGTAALALDPVPGERRAVDTGPGA